MSSCEPREFAFGTLEAPVHVVQAAAKAPSQEDAILEAVRAARAEADAIRAEARAEGLAAGHAEALDAVGPAAAALGQAVRELHALGAGTAEQCERAAVDLGVAIAEKILSATLAVEPERVLEAIRGALRGLVERERVTILVNPLDLELVRESIDGLKAELGGIEHCVVEAERRVGRGGAMIRTPDGDVDARIETKLERAREVVEAALRS